NFPRRLLSAWQLSELQQAHTPYSLAPRRKSYASSPSGGTEIMNAYRFNQIAMAVLGALLLFFGARTIINIAFEEHEEKPGYDVPGTEAGKPEGEKPAGGTDLAVLLAKGNEAKGTEVAKKCGLCHNLEKCGPNMIGPNLYSVLGRKIASHEGYEYSDALKAKEGNWDYEKINHMIENPNAFVPGTKMAIFPGLPD